jgi:hypothetical protein
MAGIQYSRARTDATGPAGDLAASGIRESATRSAKHPLALLGQGRSRRQGTLTGGAHRKKNAGRCDAVHRAAAGEALGLRSDTEEESMSDLAVRFVYSPLVSTGLKVVCLFCVLGLALSAVIVPLIAPEHLTWVLSHME